MAGDISGSVIGGLEPVFSMGPPSILSEIALELAMPHLLRLRDQHLLLNVVEGQLMVVIM